VSYKFNIQSEPIVLVLQVTNTALEQMTDQKLYGKLADKSWTNNFRGGRKL